MATKEQAPEPVSEFLRHLIERFEAGGGKLKDLAHEAGLAKSMPSQIKARTSNASFYSAAKLAPPLGYRDLPDLVVAAYTWWSSDRSKTPPGAAETPATEAMRIAAEYGVTATQIARVVERLPPAEYAQKDALWWLAHFHAERSLELERDRELRAMGHEAAENAKTRARGQQAIQEAKAQQAAARGRRPASKRTG